MATSNHARTIQQNRVSTQPRPNAAVRALTKALRRLSLAAVGQRPDLIALDYQDKGRIIDNMTQGLQRAMLSPQF